MSLVGCCKNHQILIGTILSRLLQSIWKMWENYVMNYQTIDVWTPHQHIPVNKSTKLISDNKTNRIAQARVSAHSDK